MSSDAASAVSSLHVLTGLQNLTWDLPEDSYASSDASLKALAQLTQLTSLSLGFDEHAADKAAVSALAAVASKVHTLQVLEIVAMHATDESSSKVNTEDLFWDCLDSADLKQLLNNCSMLTTLALNSVVLDQAGLDLLLAHPHIVHVSLLAVAATESRVHSPCSWQSLELSRHVDLRTLAYVPLHSLKQPLATGGLLLPADVQTEQLPDLLHKAATQLAANWRQVALDAPGLLVIDDLLDASYHVVPTFFKRVWSPGMPAALFQALAPLAACADITGRVVTVTQARDTN
jgi:hypothetical protein